MQPLNLKMNTVHVISYFDIVLVFALFMEYVLFRVGYAKQLFDKYRAEDMLRQENGDKKDHMLESILYQMDDFSLRIQKIDENIASIVAANTSVPQTRFVSRSSIRSPSGRWAGGCRCTTPASSSSIHA